jgi:hypothetical protein
MREVSEGCSIPLAEEMGMMEAKVEAKKLVLER